MRPRPKRALLYTLALLLGFLPMMPFEPRSREFHYALTVSCAIFIGAGIYVIRGERAVQGRPLWARKMLAAAWVTTIAAAIVLVMSAAWLVL